MTVVFIVDDNPGDRLLLEKAFRSFRDRVRMESAALPHEALERLARDPPPALILLDLNLPEMRGHDLLARIREAPHTSEIPVVVLSSSNAPSDRARSDELDAPHYRKPDSFHALRDLATHLVSTYLEKE